MVNKEKEKTKMQFQVRQGDVFVFMVEESEIPKEGKMSAIPLDAERTILAYGEVTGHAHAFSPGAAVKLFRMEDVGSGGDTFLRVLEPAILRHEEHAPIVLPAGNYRVRIQREYSPEAIRRVVD